MALKEYDVEIGGVMHTLQLNEADAKRYGASETAALTVEKKQRTPRNKAAKPAGRKPAAARNKAAKPETKTPEIPPAAASGVEAATDPDASV